LPTPGPPASRAVGPEAEIADGIDTGREAALLFLMIQGLIGPILIGVPGPADALAGRSPARPHIPLIRPAGRRRT